MSDQTVPPAPEAKPELTPNAEEMKAGRAVESHHQIGSLAYTVKTGILPICSEHGVQEAGIFYMAYTLSGGQDPSQRPLMFSFNGGPGSSSVWLHLGAVGPKRVQLEKDGDMPAPPFKLVDNPSTWLRHCDLVFIDPVGTGFSRAIEKDGEKKFWSLTGDIESISQFIRLFLTREERWSSPLYLVGESYGTTRAAGLAENLISNGIALSGIILVSSILNFQTARFNKGNDLPYSLFLPTYTATAWYHKKLPSRRSLSAVLKESETFASGDYGRALAKGDRLSPAERKRIVKKLSALTGLSEAYVDSTDLRINIHRFCKELLRSRKRTVGRLDSRFLGIDENAATDQPEHDPSMSIILPPYTAMLNDYVSRQLGWKTDMPYYIFNPGELWKNWSYGDAGQGHPDTSEALRSAMSRNPHMKIFVASGYYDLATPYYATEHTLAHLGLDASLRGNIRTRYYEAGHMMYIDEDCLDQLQRDVAEFLRP